ncbi:unnamed protein product [Thlaspi arvense]|uniref:KIB1-4 beta-propeller domain-containing protein n=1 Tax=Thlaspi arvense TaxID=13288 RepID=A0AAU9SN52_THLAR|nr:unnamed protein product [Thlaspi arvense]
MFSKKHDMFRIPGSGGHLIGSWDPCKDSNNPNLQSLRFQNLPRLPTATRELLDSCCTSEHLVESRTTGETFLVKLYEKTTEIVEGVARMKTERLMVFRLDDEGNAVYTQDIGDLCIFISKNEPFCVPASSFPGMLSNSVKVVDSYEYATVLLDDLNIVSGTMRYPAPYHIPPQNMD